MNLYRNINEWLIKNYEPLNKWMYFNATPIVVGTVSMNSVAGDTVTRQFVNGVKEHQIIFAIECVKTYDPDGTSEINLTAMDEVLAFTEWLAIQSKNKSYPDFGENQIVKKMEVLSNIPTVLVDTQASLMRSQFQCRITYNDESEVIR